MRTGIQWPTLYRLLKCQPRVVVLDLSKQLWLFTYVWHYVLQLFLYCTSLSCSLVSKIWYYFTTYKNAKGRWYLTFKSPGTILITSSIYMLTFPRWSLQPFRSNSDDVIIFIEVSKQDLLRHTCDRDVNGVRLELGMSSRKVLWTMIVPMSECQRIVRSQYTSSMCCDARVMWYCRFGKMAYTGCIVTLTSLQWQKSGGRTRWVGNVVRALGFAQRNGDVSSWTVERSELRLTEVPDHSGTSGPWPSAWTLLNLGRTVSGASCGAADWSTDRIFRCIVSHSCLQVVVA